MKNKKLRYDRIIIFLVIILLLIFGVYKLFTLNGNKKKVENDLMINLVGKTKDDVNTFINQYEFDVNIKYEYDDNVLKDKIISQSINEKEKINKKDKLELVISLGKLDLEKLESDGINEMGKVPVMMYHGIVDKLSSETSYTGGNVDKDGYNRTYEAFDNDLEFYYSQGYRMVRLIDYVNGDFDTPYGYSPIVLTFDDGNENNIKVTGLDSDGNIIIDDHSAVGILEKYKKKYKDFNVTATFFVNDDLFGQPLYNEKILKWLVDNGYDIGNHTRDHNNLSNTTTLKTQEVIASIYKKLDGIIPNKYVNIIALPFGNPIKKTHENFQYVLNGIYEDYTYETIAALRVGWEPEVSPFNKDFDKTYIKRCRAYDNEGKEFDIKMVFEMLEKRKYISDGNKDTIVINEDDKNNVIDTTKRIITY